MKGDRAGRSIPRDARISLKVHSFKVAFNLSGLLPSGRAVWSFSGPIIKGGSLNGAPSVLPARVTRGGGARTHE
jgi:hypothetical protein